MNPTLFASSVVFGFIHAYLLFYYYECPILATSIVVGVLTSLMNHGRTCNLSKLLDRLAMTVGVSINALRSDKLALTTLTVAVLLFLLAKKYKLDALHVAAHAFATVTHVLLLARAS